MRKTRLKIEPSKAKQSKTSKQSKAKQAKHLDRLDRSRREKKVSKIYCHANIFTLHSTDRGRRVGAAAVGPPPGSAGPSPGARPPPGGVLEGARLQPAGEKHGTHAWPEPLHAKLEPLPRPAVRRRVGVCRHEQAQPVHRASEANATESVRKILICFIKLQNLSFN